MTDILRFEHVSAGYLGNLALEDVSFVMPEGSCCVSVIGPNGAGKSTLFKVALGLMRPIGGNVEVFGKSPREIDRRKNPIGYMPQTREIDLSFPISVRDVVLMGGFGRLGLLRRPGRIDRLVAEQALDQVGSLHLAGRQIGELSGGERQRVFIARSLAQGANLIFLDEPAAGLDVSAKRAIYELIEKLHEQGISTITATHDLTSVELHDFEKVLCLNKRVIALGTRFEVLNEQVLRDTFSSAFFHSEEGEGHIHL